MSNSNDWLRVRKDRLCPICGHADWCLVSSDGSAAICPRTESNHRCGDAGWLHRLRQDRFDTHGYRTLNRWHSVRCAQAFQRPDYSNIAAQFQTGLEPNALSAFAQHLGLTTQSLLLLEIGWSAEHWAWTFPMRDLNKIVGIRFRREDGGKFSLKGGKEGLFIPAIASEESRLIIGEGATDTAALLDLGLLWVVGRPSCSGGIDLLTGFVQQKQPREVIIISDQDVVGQSGAEKLASVLVAYCSAVRVVIPKHHKDVREFFRVGGTRAQLEKAIELAPLRQLKIESRRMSHGQ